MTYFLSIYLSSPEVFLAYASVDLCSVFCIFTCRPVHYLFSCEPMHYLLSAYLSTCAVFFVYLHVDLHNVTPPPPPPLPPDRLVGLVVKASVSRMEDPGFESRGVRIGRTRGRTCVSVVCHFFLFSFLFCSCCCCFVLFCVCVLFFFPFLSFFGGEEGGRFGGGGGG